MDYDQGSVEKQIKPVPLLQVGAYVTWGNSKTKAEIRAERWKFKCITPVSVVIFPISLTFLFQLS